MKETTDSEGVNWSKEWPFVKNEVEEKIGLFLKVRARREGEGVCIPE
jgi:hypothetical protein